MKVEFICFKGNIFYYSSKILRNKSIANLAVNRRYKAKARFEAAIMSGCFNKHLHLWQSVTPIKTIHRRQ
jgi:hypothetical protein